MSHRHLVITLALAALGTTACTEDTADPTTCSYFVQTSGTNGTLSGSIEWSCPPPTNVCAIGLDPTPSGDGGFLASDTTFRCIASASFTAGADCTEYDRSALYTGLDDGRFDACRCAFCGDAICVRTSSHIVACY